MDMHVLSAHAKKKLDEEACFTSYCCKFCYPQNTDVRIIQQLVLCTYYKHYHMLGNACTHD